MEPVPGTEADYRFTDEGYAWREEILREEEDRIERQRYEPPDANLSEAAKALLRRIATGERVEITDGNRPAFRELAEARIIYLMHTFTRGAESGYRFERRHDARIVPMRYGRDRPQEAAGPSRVSW